ncbi:MULTISPECIES: hypothetical protein [unclassified Streptomyces]|uniref:hypothetical protein n=1 Tax=unclassified Streptomyces TaxID=2593676 RepID=UPI001F5465CD|nr:MULTISPECIES: hypothetical protein [unclassified Streptomyces]
MRRTPLGNESGGTAEEPPPPRPEGPVTQGDTTMYEFELHKILHAELLRRADLRRLADEARRSRRFARRSGRQEPGRTVSSGGVRDRFTPAA